MKDRWHVLSCPAIVASENAACWAFAVCYPGIVRFEEIKTEIARLPREDQDHLAAYLVHLRHEQDSKIRSEIAAKIDDKDPSNWISVDELKEKWKD